jgi:hypothetical protein
MVVVPQQTGSLIVGIVVFSLVRSSRVVGPQNLINQFAEIFWASKGIATKRAKAPYKPGEEVVYPVL